MGTPQIMETREDGRTFGWLGVKCEPCEGHGRRDDEHGEERTCPNCGGTGEEYGEIKPDAVAPAS